MPKLSNKIKVDKTDYDVTATTAEVADKVINGLQLVKYKEDGIAPPESFDGSEEKTLHYVPADEGGQFGGPIYVPCTDESIDDQIVLNYADIKSKIVKLLSNTSILYTWNGTSLDSTPNGESNIDSISVVQGPEASIGAFKELNDKNKWLSAYLYIDPNTGGIYFGTGNGYTQLNLIASNANQVANNLTIKLNSGNTEGSTKFTFNGSVPKTINITPDKINAAAKEHGTHVQLSSATPKINGTASCGSATTAARADHIHPTDTSRAAKAHEHSAGDITSGKLDVKYGGTGQTSVENIEAGKDANGVTISSGYFRRAVTNTNRESNSNQIIVSTSIPDDDYHNSDRGYQNGDIWINYKL